MWIVRNLYRRKRHERFRMIRLDTQQFIQEDRCAKQVARGAPPLRRTMQKINMRT